MTTSPSRIPALTIRRPWAQLIIAGHKHVENRGWNTSYRGLLIVHAGQAWERSGDILAAAEGIYLDRGASPAGYIGTVRLVDVHAATSTCVSEGPCEPWGMPEQYHWILADAKPFDEAVPGNGMLGLFIRVPDSVRQLVAHLDARGEL